MTILDDLFLLGMKRNLPNFRPFKEGVALNIGAGSHNIPFATPLNFPSYDANRDAIPYGMSTVDTIHCYHVLEHLSNPIFFLKECERVLKSGGIMNIVVPHYQSEMAHHDITHQRFFALDTFKNLFSDTYYYSSPDGWKLRLVGSLAIGVADRNLCIITQLEKR